MIQLFVLISFFRIKPMEAYLLMITIHLIIEKENIYYENLHLIKMHLEASKYLNVNIYSTAKETHTFSSFVFHPIEQKIIKTLMLTSNQMYFL